MECRDKPILGLKNREEPAAVPKPVHAVFLLYLMIPESIRIFTVWLDAVMNLLAGSKFIEAFFPFLMVGLCPDFHQSYHTSRL